MAIQRVNVSGLGRLPAFSHASIVGNQVFVSGLIGAAGDSLELVEGGMGAQTRQILDNMKQVLEACGCGLDDVAMVHAYITDMSQFPAMNEEYVEAMGDEPPGRITVGCAELALGAIVEMDCVAFIP